MDPRIVDKLVELGYLRQSSPLTRPQYVAAVLHALAYSQLAPAVCLPRDKA